MQFKPVELAGQPGYYPVRPPDQWYYNTDLGMILNGTRLMNGKRTFTIELVKKNETSDPVPHAPTLIDQVTLPVFIDNQRCTAAINGYGRQRQYDAAYTIAFALTLQP